MRANNDGKGDGAVCQGLTLGLFLGCLFGSRCFFSRFSDGGFFGLSLSHRRFLGSGFDCRDFLNRSDFVGYLGFSSSFDRGGLLDCNFNRGFFRHSFGKYFFSNFRLRCRSSSGFSGCNLCGFSSFRRSFSLLGQFFDAFDGLFAGLALVRVVAGRTLT